MTIVCAIHFSDPSLAAVKVAARLARTHREPLWLVDMVGPVAGVPGEPPTVSPALVRQAGELARGGLVVNTVALSGLLAPTLRKLCVDQRAGLLVLGDSQRVLGPLNVGPLDRFADRMGVPVLIVRDAQPFEAWASGLAPLRVMLALDRTWQSAAARDWIAGLAAYGAIDLSVLYLWWPRDETERREWTVTSGQSGSGARSQRAWVEAEAAFSGLPPNVRRQVRLEAGQHHLGPQLLRLADKAGAGVCVLGTQPHRGPCGQQWSVSHELLALAPMSVACVPEPAQLAAPQAAETQLHHVG